jgi:hypothetical protein
MKKIFPILFIGLLSMLFAEVFSGASQMWFFNGWALLVTFPLYLAHILFFLGLALKTKKTSLSQLYLFGVLFGLYEAWITKVLWQGYMGSTPSMGTFLGIATNEFAAVTLFWHPIMSFILPILVFEITTGKYLKGHEAVLEKTKKKSWLIVLFLILVMPSIANGNKFNIVSANAALIGTLLLVWAVYLLARKSDVLSLQLEKKGWRFLIFYLIALYAVTFFVLLPERIPTTIMPYISILVVYAVVILAVVKSSQNKLELNNISKTKYSLKDLLKFMLWVILIVNLSCIFQQVFYSIFIVGYFSLSLIGIIIFVVVLFKGKFLLSSPRTK